MKLTTKQRVHLEMLIGLQKLSESNPNYFNNGLQHRIETVLKKNGYNEGDDKRLLNEMNEKYKKFLTKL